MTSRRAALVTRRLCRGVAIGLCLVAVTLASRPSAAEPDSLAKARARVHFEQGTRLYKVSEFRAAYEQYKQSFLALPDPALLYNMGQCLRRLGEYEEAIKLYRSYLLDNPAAHNRARLERQITELQTMAHARAIGAPQPATAPPEVSQTGVRAEAEESPESPESDGALEVFPREEPAAATEPPIEHRTATPTPQSSPTPEIVLPPANPPRPMAAPLPTDVARPEPPRAQPLLARWWFWAAVGGVIALGLGVAVGAGVFTDRSDAPCRDGWVCPD